MGGESSQSTESHSSCGKCKLSNSTLPIKRHPTWVGPGKHFPMWEVPGRGGLVNIIRHNCKDRDYRNGEDVA